MKSTELPTIERAAYKPSEFAALFGREKTWAYRLYYAGKLRMIEGYGGRLVPADEIARIKGEAKTVTA